MTLRKLFGSLALAAVLPFLVTGTPVSAQAPSPAPVVSSPTTGTASVPRTDAKTDPKPAPKAPPAMPGSAGLKLPADLTVDPGELYVTIVAETEGDDVNWIVVGSVPVKYSPLGKTLVLSAPPGAVIHVYAYATVGTKATPPARTIVTVKGGADPVAPAPKQPDTGEPPAKKFHVTIVEDPALRANSPWVADIINDKAMRESLTKSGYTFRLLSTKDPEFAKAAVAPYVEAAGGLPCLIVQDDATGKVYNPQKLPQTTAAFLEAVEKAVKKAKE
jgi:hypothetical protein